MLVLATLFWMYIGAYPWLYSERLLFAEKFMISIICSLGVVCMWVLLYANY